MICPACQRENRDDARFCDECGRAVRGAGAAPGRHDLRVYTPKHLADKILRSKSALEGELKQVTILFADVQRSMELAEGFDPEEWHRIMDRFFAILAEGVHRFEGTINQFTGDGIMALFGAPIAHEDHAQRACYAALHLTQELRRYADELRVERGLNFGVRIGLNSGEVVVGKIGDDLRMDYTAQGPTVGLAARMQQIAAPERVYVTHYTARLVEGFCQLRDLGQSKVKGVSEPLRVYELEGIGPMRTRLDVARSRGFFRFVGRTDEMAVLEAALEQAREGNGQVIGVVGEAGVGKSRLCLEFIERARARGISLLEAHCPSHGKTIPFLPILELLRGYFGITGQDPDPTARQKIAGRLLLLDRAFDESLPVIFDFLGVPDPERPAPLMDPEARQRQLFGFVRRLAEDPGSSEHVVIFLDDLHWIDAGSDAFLAELLEATGGTRTFLLVNFRPEYHASWMGKPYYQPLPLVPLGPEAVEELLADILGDDPSVAGLPELIRERTGGNPFFIEELVQSLVESGSLAGARGAYQLAKRVEELEIPATVQSLLAARIDRLAEREKQVLQTAAVLGKKFREAVLKRVIEFPDADVAASLSALQGAEFIYEEALYPEAEYVFKHPLTQEVAYASQLAERRRNTHAAAARAIVELYPDKQDEQAALLAHHWEEAGEALEAARWHARAAGWVRAGDPAQSVRHWQRVHELVEPLPETDELVSLHVLACLQILQFGWRLGLSQAEVDALYAEGRALAARQGDTRAVAYLANAHSTSVGTSGNAKAYLEHAIEAARLAEECGDLEVRCLAQTGLLYSHWAVGRLAEARDFADRGLELVGEDRTIGVHTVGFSAFVFLLILRGMLRTLMGELEGGRRDLDRGVELARELKDAENLGWGLGFSAAYAILSGEPGNARAQALESLEIAEKLGSALSLANAHHSLGEAQLVHEEWQEAIDPLEQALEIARRRGTGLELEALVLANLARAYLGAGQTDRARATAEEGVRVARQRGSRHLETWARLSRARVLLASDGAKARTAVEKELARALELVEKTGGQGYEPQILVERAELARVLGDDAARELELQEAHRLFVEMGATGHARRVAAQLESLPGRS